MLSRLLLLATINAGLAATAWSQAGGSSERVVFFSGNVLLDDGSAPPDPVLIQRVCEGRARDEAWTDSQGRFGFKVESGAADNTSADATRPPGQAPDLNRAMGSSTQYSMPLSSSLRTCELQGVLAGFRSERISMALKGGGESVRVGTILLHPLSKANALTVSATTLEAPSKARKAYEKGLAAKRDRKWDRAAAEFTRAVDDYPKYAIAWYELGVARLNLNDSAGAIEAWKQALQSDPKYVKPIESLAALYDRTEDWTQSEIFSRQWIQLDAADFPAAFLFNAIANARLNKMEEAEQAARRGLAIDRERRLPRLSYVLGLILMQKHEYAESAKCFRTYLELAPNAPNAAAVREELPKLEQAAALPR